MYIYNVHVHVCVSIEAADVCLQCTRTMCNIECFRFTTVKESSVCYMYTYIIQEEALVKGFYLCQHSLIPRDHTHLCGKGPFLYKWVWCLGTTLSSTHLHAVLLCLVCLPLLASFFLPSLISH